MDNNQLTEQEFKLKNELYFSKFRLKHQKELSAFKPYIFLKENKNILDHLLVAGALGEIICNLLFIKGLEKESIISALILHDANKLDEKEYLRKVALKHTPSYVDLQRIKKQEDKRLLKFGFSKRTVGLTEEVITHEQGGPVKIPEMIVFLVDAMLIAEKVVDTHTRFRLTRMGWHGGKKEFDEDLRLINQKYSEEFFKGAPGHNNRSHFDVQEETAERICKYFYKMLKDTHPDINSPEYKYLERETYKLPLYFEAKLKEKIMQS